MNDVPRKQNKIYFLGNKTYKAYFIQQFIMVLNQNML